MRCAGITPLFTPMATTADQAAQATHPAKDGKP